MIRQFVLTLMVLICSVGACAEIPTTIPTTLPTQPFAKIRGIEYAHEQRANPPMHLHVMMIDLMDPAVHVVVRKAGEVKEADAENKWQTRLLRTSDIARRDQLDVAVNGDFFMARDVLKTPIKNVPYFVGNRAAVCGLAMTDGQLWSKNKAAASLRVDAAGKVSIATLNGEKIPAGTREIISGMSMIVTDGKNTGVKADVAPHTSAGLDREGKKLILLVVDGRRQNYSAGMHLHDLADEMIRLGCYQAIQLDGGGSTTMVAHRKTADAVDDYVVINRPSDGHDLLFPMSVERAVANVLGVKVDSEKEKN